MIRLFFKEKYAHFVEEVSSQKGKFLDKEFFYELFFFLPRSIIPLISTMLSLKLEAS